MARRCKSGAALFFTAMVLAGCSLVESVIVVEPVKKPSSPSTAVTRTASLAEDTGRCGAGPGGMLCSETAISRAYSAKYDSGPVLKPIKKRPENKAAEADDSTFVKAVKSWFRTGMQLHTWIK